MAAKFEVSIVDLNAVELDELVTVIAEHCGGHTLEGLIIRAGAR